MRRVMVVCAALAVLMVPACQREPSAPNPPLKLSVAVYPGPDSGLIAIADDKKFFQAAGLETAFKEFPSGAAALEAMSRGEADLATVTDYAFSWRVRIDPSLRIVASIGLASSNQIVALTGRGIKQASDLKGKKVGFSPNTTTDYFLTTYLLTNGIPAAAVTRVAISPANAADALARGEVDAMVAFREYSYAARQRLGDKVVILEVERDVRHWLLVTKEAVIRAPAPLTRFVRALGQAEDFVLAHPDEARDIITRRFHLDPFLMRETWGETGTDLVNLSLNQSLITSLETFVRWRMRNEGASGPIPNFLTFVYSGALDEVRPRAVTLFR